MIVHIKELFPNDGQEVVGKFAYPAFNTINLETTLGIIAAAESLGVPIILQVSEGSIKYAGLSTAYEIMATVSDRAKIPIALHMDHGRDMEQLKMGIDLGFSSVMIDHSNLSFEENVRDTKIMVEFAHSHGAWVQGEIGKIRGTEDWVNVSDMEAFFTDPKEAMEFVSQTGVDTLAPSVGTIHGIIKMRDGVKAHVDTALIQSIYQMVRVPLVLHGASGVDVATVSQAIASGVAIINIDTELQIAFAEALRASVAANMEEVDPRKLLQPAIGSVRAAAEKKLIEFGTRRV